MTDELSRRSVTVYLTEYSWHSPPLTSPLPFVQDAARLVSVSEQSRNAELSRAGEPGRPINAGASRNAAPVAVAPCLTRTCALVSNMAT